MLTTDQKVSNLFKKSVGKAETSTSRQFFEEPYASKAFVLPSQVWNQGDLIPTTAPGGTDGQVTGVITRYIDKVLTVVAGAPNAWYHADLKDAIPFDFGDGSYNYAIKDSLNNNVAFGAGDWLLDTVAGILYFYGANPTNLPPKISFYKYSGTKGVGSGSGTGSAITTSISQVAHGFTALTPIFFNLTLNVWQKAQANNNDTLATHVVSSVEGLDSFTACQIGKITVTAHGKSTGYWFTSNLVAGETVSISPVLSNPVFLVQDANTIHILDYRPIDMSSSGVTSHADLTDIEQAGLGVLNGHVSNLSQDFYGLKTFKDDTRIELVGECDTNVHEFTVVQWRYQDQLYERASYMSDMAPGIAIALTERDIDGNCLLLKKGIVTNPLWNLSGSGPIWLGVDGAILADKTGNGSFNQVLGWKITPTTIFFNPSMSILEKAFDPTDLNNRVTALEENNLVSITEEYGWNI
jgi:hypothetical protein